MGIEFEDNRETVKEKLKNCAVAWLYEASGEMSGQVMRNQRVRTGRTKGSWRYRVDEEKMADESGFPAFGWSSRRIYCAGRFNEGA